MVWKKILLFDFLVLSDVVGLINMVNRSGL